MAKWRIMQIMLHGSLGYLVLWWQRSWWNSNGVIPNGNSGQI